MLVVKRLEIWWHTRSNEEVLNSANAYSVVDLNEWTNITLDFRVQDHVQEDPQNRVSSSVSASDEEISYHVKEIVLCETAVLLSSSFPGHYLHQVHVHKIPWVVSIQCFPVRCNVPL